MKTFFRNIGIAFGSLALASTAVPAIAQDDSAMQPEVYDLLIDCGTLNLFASMGAEGDAAQVAEYEGKAVAFWRVGKAYGEKNEASMKADTDASIERMQTLISDTNEAPLEEKLNKCVAMEEVVMEINSTMGK